MSPIELVSTVHLVATLYMLGLIWFVQVVHYPLLGEVGGSGYAGYQQRHMRLTTFVVALPMLLELCAAAMLVVLRPDGAFAWLAWIGVTLLAAIWLSTLLLQMPAHRRLEQGFDPGTHARLVRSNWLRTAAWTARAVLALGISFGWAGSAAAAEGAADDADPRDVLGFTMKRLEGKPQDLGEYRGKVVMLVNVASRCGYTPQYSGLQKLYETYRERGFVILGFPSNDFGGQEPGSDQEIARFCRATYGVSFPMFSKIRVKGADKHELYARLSGQPAPVGGEVGWNFSKFLVDRQGRVVARFASGVTPFDSELTKTLEKLLAEPATSWLR